MWWKIKIQEKQDGHERIKKKKKRKRKRKEINKKKTGRNQCNKEKRRFSNQIILADPVAINHGSIKDDITK